MGNPIVWGDPKFLKAESFDVVLRKVMDRIVYKRAVELPKNGFLDLFSDRTGNEKSNEVYFLDDVTDYSVTRFKNRLQQIADGILNKNIDADHIKVYVDSYGGDLLAGFNAYDEIMNIGKKVPIHTIVDGKSASAATFINVAGSKRYIRPNSFMLVHELSSGSQGKHTAQEDHYKNMSMFMDRIKNIYKNRTKFDSEQLNDLLRHDLWLDAENSIKYGLADEIA